MSNIVEFQRPIDEHSPEAILADVLEQVQSGKVDALGIAISYKDGAVNTAYSKSVSAGLLMGAIALLQYRVCRE